MRAVSNSRGAIRANVRGFTLIEVLVAFVVLAVGVIGIISLMIMSKNSLHQSVQRTQAVNLADAMVERIRSNPTEIDAGYIGKNPVGGGDLPKPNVDCAVATCSPADLAAYDLWMWEQALLGETVVVDGEPAGGLIQPQACITFTAEPGLAHSGRLNVTVQWRGLEESEDAVSADEGGVACGGALAGADRYRRQVTVNTIVLDDTELRP